MSFNGTRDHLAYPTPATTPPDNQDNPLTVLVSTRAVLTSPHNALFLSPATIVVSATTGTILSVTTSVIPATSFPFGTIYINHSPHILIPGLVDAHVHLNEPGRTEWEGFWTGTRAAASGGVTTVIDMPLNAIPPTTTVNGLKEKIKAAQGQCWVDVGFYGGIIPGNTDQLLPLVDAGVRGFKGFLIASGVDEFPAVSSLDIALAMTTLKNAPTTLLFHAEMIPPISASVGDDVQKSIPPLAPSGPLDSYATFLSSRPPALETYAIEEVLSLAHLAPTLQLHIVHLSAIECIPLLRAARQSGIKISAETCFHYLALAAEDVPTGDTRHKCCPPIRSSINRAGLWAELSAENSVLETIVSDHSPCTPELKLLPDHIAGSKDTVEEAQEKGDFFASWGGISSVGLGLPILWTSAHASSALSSPLSACSSTHKSHSHASSTPHTPPPSASSSFKALSSIASAQKKPSKLDILDVVRLCAVNTARQVGLQHRKGAIAPGMDADICVFSDDETFVVENAQMLFRNKVTPYQGKRLRGLVKETYLRGRSVYTSEEGFAEEKGPSGVLLLEKRKA